ncbi:MAG: hypothetical protein LBS90_09115 [Oscillospiraceae bacterium]|jgi:putative sporulation protein YtaF|nr:hypothetical protein [Oscillospiraceae bacterium]
MLGFARVLSASLIAVSLSLDLFCAFLSYGALKIRVPAASAALVVAVQTAAVLVAALFGSALAPLLPAAAVRTVSFCVLFTIGLIQLLSSGVKALIRRGLSRKWRFSALGLRLVLEICADPEAADADGGGTLSLGEAATLALAICLDGTVIGLAAGADGGGTLLLASATLVFSALGAVLGLALGRAASRTKRDISPFGGVLLIAVAIARLAG